MMPPVVVWYSFFHEELFQEFFTGILQRYCYKSYSVLVVMSYEALLVAKIMTHTQRW